MDPATWLLVALALAGALAIGAVAWSRRERKREEKFAWDLVERGFGLRGDPLVTGVIEGLHAGREARVAMERERAGWQTVVRLRAPNDADAWLEARLDGRVRDAEKILAALRRLEEQAERA